MDHVIPPPPTPVEEALRERIRFLEEDLNQVRNEARYNRKPDHFEYQDNRVRELRMAATLVLGAVVGVIIIRRIMWLQSQGG